MPDVMNIRMEGFKEVNKVLRKLPQEIGQKVTRGALRKGGNVIRDAAIQKAPYSSIDRATKYAGKKKYYTLHLRDQIKVRSKKADGINARMEVSVGEAFWGKFSEFGTSRQAAKPWMRPAFDNTRESAITAIAEELGKGLEKAAKKLAGPLAKSGLIKRKRK